MSALSDSEVYQFTLRVAYLAYLVQHSGRQSDEAGRSDGKANNRSSDSWTSAFGSMGDIFRAEAKSAKEVRFPKDFVRTLGGRIESVARGSDAAFSDPLFRSVVGVFYGSYNSPAFQRQLKDNRKVEELIITFVSTASGVLKKRITGDDWKAHLMSQVAYFVRLIKDALRQTKGVPGELVERLNIYLDRLGPPLASPIDGASEMPASFSHHAVSPHAFELVRQVALIFKVPEEQLKRDIIAIRRFCTEKAALRDLKVCMGMVQQGASFPGRREDFDNDDAYAMWRRNELESLQQLILLLAKQNRDVLQGDGTRPLLQSLSSSSSFGGPVAVSSSLRTSMGDLGGSYEEISSRPLSYASSDSVPEGGAEFVYIPPSPALYYSRLLECALSVDLDIVKQLAADEEVSLRILFKSSQDLLIECALRWRLMLPFRAVSFLDEIARRFAKDEIPIIQCVTEAIADVDRVENEWEYDRWTIKDRTSLRDALSGLLDVLLRRIYDGIVSLDGTTVEEVRMLEEAAHLVCNNTIFREDVHDAEERYEELRRAIRVVALHQYEELRLRAASAKSAEEHISELLRLCDWLRGAATTLDKRFREPLLGKVDIVALFVGEAGPLLAADLHASHDAIEAMLEGDPTDTPDTIAAKERDIRSLFEAAREVASIHDAFCPQQPLHADFSAFEPWIRKWLTATHSKTIDWVQSAVSIDSFTPEGQERYSTSIIDLIDSCKSAVAFVQELRWPDPRANALFMTQLSQTISKAIEEYCAKIEQLFNTEMFPRTEEEPELDERTSAWLIKAKGLYAADKKAQPFVFTPTSLVKLNNIQAARNLLDKMYSTLDADKVAEILRSKPDPLVDESAATSRFLFSVKAVLGEKLVAKKEGAKVDPFLTLSDEKGRRVAKTRTLYDTPDPRWAETFDISVQGSMWLAATVYDRNLVDEHDLLGRAYIHLDQKAYGDFLAHDLWLKLDTQGRLLLRISMEGEKDDIQFYFGRAFRSLKRTEADMVRVIVDKMSPFVRHFLSRTVIRSLVKKGFNFDLNLRLEKMRIKDLGLRDVNLGLKDMKLDRLRHMFSSSNSGLPEIPPVPGAVESPVGNSQRLTLDDGMPTSQAKRKAADLTDTQIEDAIGLLFEYFEDTFATLKGILSDAAFAVVMSKIWKEVLTTIEALVVPQLSDQPAEMKPLSDKEVYIAIRWLKGLLNFFHAEGAGVPLEDLQSPRYHALVSLPLYYDMGTDELEMECARAVNQLFAAATGAGGSSVATLRQRARSKSIYAQRNLGTIRQRKRDKRQERSKDYRGTAEMMMRILRMRPRTQEFLMQQIVTLRRIDQESAKPPPLQRRGQSDLRRPQPTRLTVPETGVSGARSAGSRPHTPVSLVDRPASAYS